MQLAQKLSRANTMQYRYTFRKVNILGTPLVSPELIPLLSQPVRVGFFSASFIQDRRDDPIDSHHGIYTSIDLAVGLRMPSDPRPDFGRVVAQQFDLLPHSPRIWCWRGPRTFGMIQRYAGPMRFHLPSDFSPAAAHSPTARSPIFRPDRATRHRLSRSAEMPLHQYRGAAISPHRRQLGRRAVQ